MALPDEPYTRVERYLARLAGQDVDIPDYPITRIECYLDYLCGNGGGVPAPNAGAHNAVFRGKSLGTSFTSAQSQAITGGTFENLFVGDYWTIGETVYRIAGFDLFYGLSPYSPIAHHAVIVTDAGLYESAMNDTSTTDGGYLNSKLKTEGLANALETVKAAFGADHILSRYSLLTTAASGGIPSGWEWVPTFIDIMSESQVFGRGAWATQSRNGYNVAERYCQFPLFSLTPQYVTSRQYYWLQDIASATEYAAVSTGGNVNRATASDTNKYVRPFFCLA